MIHTIDEFLVEWTDESQRTLKVLNGITDATLNTKIEPKGRTLGFLAWHIVTTIAEMMSKTGLELIIPDGSEDEPKSINQIISEYEKLSLQMVNLLNSNWTNDTLNHSFNMYGEVWKGNSVLESLIKHEIHHRAQITVFMRKAGLTVPGIYGPSREDWALYGMEAHK